MRQFFKKEEVLFLLQFVVYTSLIISLLYLFTPDRKPTKSFFFSAYEMPDSLIKKMSLDDKIAQLLLFDARNIDIETIKSELENWQVAGLIYETHEIAQQLQMWKIATERSKIPAFFCLKTHTPDFLSELPLPKQMLVDAVVNDSLLADYNKLLAEYISRLGFNFVLLDEKNKTNQNLASRLSIKQILLAGSYLPDYKADIANLEQLVLFPQDSLNALSSGISKFLLNNGKLKLVNLSDWQTFNRQAFFTEKFDMLLTSVPPSQIIAEIKQLLKSGELTENQIDRKLKRILASKNWLAAQQKSTPSKASLDSLNNLKNRLLIKKLHEQSVTLIKNEQNLLPFADVGRIDFVVLGKKKLPALKSELQNYSNEKLRYLSAKKFLRLKSKQLTDTLVVIIENQELDSLILTKLSKKITKLQAEHILVVANLNSPVLLDKLPDFQTVIQCYDDTAVEERTVINLLFGSISAGGKLPISLQKFARTTGITQTPIHRLKYVKPEEGGFNQLKIRKIDTIIQQAITAGAMPGCQVFVAKAGQVVWNKAYGYQTYNCQQAVQRHDLYDLASLTKIVGTTLAAMKMYETGKISLDSTLGTYFNNTEIEYTRIKADTIISIDTVQIADIKDFKELLATQDTVHINDTTCVIIDTLLVRATPKHNIFTVPLRQILMHQSGISPSLPILPYLFYKKYYRKLLETRSVSHLASVKASALNSDYLALQAIEIPQRFQPQLIPVIADNQAIASSLQKNTPNLFSETDAHNTSSITSYQPPISTFSTDSNSLKPKQIGDSIQAKLQQKESKKAAFNYFYSENDTDSSHIQIAKNFYLRNNFLDSIWFYTKQVRVYSQNLYQYSDINMVLLQTAIDSVNQIGIDSYLKDNFYKPLGLKEILYHPLQQFDIQQIIPTAQDKYWRAQLLRGYVHDPTAALLGGVAGNAGLFASAERLGILAQMLLNGGTYGGKRYLKKETIDLFTATQADGHRGLGFDKAVRGKIVSRYAPSSTYGHTGFTGTCLWIDPENELVFIFLSNRVYPSERNWKINTLRVRQRIHDAIYEAFKF